MLTFKYSSSSDWPVQHTPILNADLVVNCSSHADCQRHTHGIEQNYWMAPCRASETQCSTGSTGLRRWSVQLVHRSTLTSCARWIGSSPPLPRTSFTFLDADDVAPGTSWECRPDVRGPAWVYLLKDWPSAARTGGMTRTGSSVPENAESWESWAAICWVQGRAHSNRRPPLTTRIGAHQTEKACLQRRPAWKPMFAAPAIVSWDRRLVSVGTRDPLRYLRGGPHPGAGRGPSPDPGVTKPMSPLKKQGDTSDNLPPRGAARTARQPPKIKR